MKLIIAIIQPSKLEDVKDALSDVEVFRLTIMDVQGFGRQKGHAEVYRGREIGVNLVRKVQLQIGVNTVRTHVSSILGKLGLSSRTQAARYALERGLISSEDDARQDEQDLQGRQDGH